MSPLSTFALVPRRHPLLPEQRGRVVFTANLDIDLEQYIKKDLFASFLTENNANE